MSRPYLPRDSGWRELAGGYALLRGGYIRGTATSLQLVNAEWIRGVRVSGRLDDNGRGTLTVSGPASGTITYTRTGARGTIDGRAFTLD